jgi:acetoin utilization deacetylase AcuC-like enzyme
MLSILLGVSDNLHEPGRGHPDSPERLTRLVGSLSAAGYEISRCSREATRDELITIHEPTYVDRVLGLDGIGGALDQETLLGPSSVKAALNAAGTALEMSDDLLGGNDRQSFALVRPPGHHARPGGGAGYCVFNNVALAAERLRRKGLRVCILDWDVHHGDGTEDAFSANSDVLFVSIHSDGLFPEDTGRAADVGRAAGRGCTVNIPLPAGSTLAAYALATDRVILPAVRRFGPDVVLSSVGFDAHERDPQGNMLLKTGDFAYVGSAIRMAATGSASGRIGMVLEGGYDVEMIGQCAVELLRGLEGKSVESPAQDLTEEERSRIEEVAKIHGLE